jgi:hypothetical protein
MNSELKIRNIVVVGSFNPISFDKYFFVKNGIMTEEQITPNCMFLPQLVQVITPSFHLVANPVQIVINAIKPSESFDIAELLQKILGTSTGFVISGSGVNFNWFITNDNESDLEKYTKELCFNGSNIIQSTFFTGDNTTFGFYSSKNFLDCRLKLDVKPIRYKTDEMKEDKAALQFEFNFHKDYKDSETDSKLLLKILKDYKQYQAESNLIMEKIW